MNNSTNYTINRNNSVLYLLLVFIMAIIVLQLFINIYNKYCKKYCKKNEQDNVSLYSSDSNEVYEDDELCAICLSQISKNYYQTNCDHKFHKKCLDNLVKFNNDYSCPICRNEIKSTKFIP